MNRISVLAFSCLLLAASIQGQPSAGPAAAQAATFGPYEAIAWNKDYIHDVRVDDKRNVFIQLHPAQREKELAIKSSNERFSRYQEWWHGSKELIAPANQGRRPYEWTDRVHAQAKFIEYWIDGELVLHLRRLD